MPFRHVYRFSIDLAGLVIRIARFAAIVIIFYLIYRLLLDQFLDGSQQIVALLGIWLVTAYAALPRLHRILTTYYLPNYFVGRVRSPSGLLADPVNVALFGKEARIHEAMRAAGWHLADPLTPKTFFKTVYSVLLRKSYPQAPVGDMVLFNRRYDFAYQQEVNGSPRERHHVRFWKTPRGWRLPGGHEVEWLAAATYDTHVGLKIFTLQIDHLIHENVDEERDYVVKTLKQTSMVEKIEVIKHFTDAFHDRNNGGDRIQTDGSLPFIYFSNSH